MLAIVEKIILGGSLSSFLLNALERTLCLLPDNYCVRYESIIDSIIGARFFHLMTYPENLRCPRFLMGLPHCFGRYNTQVCQPLLFAIRLFNYRRNFYSYIVSIFRSSGSRLWRPRRSCPRQINRQIFGKKWIYPGVAISVEQCVIEIGSEIANNFCMTWVQRSRHRKSRGRSNLDESPLTTNTSPNTFWFDCDSASSSMKLNIL